MKQHEKILFEKLQHNNLSGDVPLKNIRNALGSVAHAVGNPLSKTEIVLQFTTFFQDNLGNPILPAALPVALQTAIPFFIFGLTDFYGGYLKANQIVHTGGGWQQANVLNGFGIYNLDVFGVVGVGFNVVAGDFINTFIPINPAFNIAATTCIHCNNIAYGTFLNSFVSDLITIDLIRYIVPIANINQFINPIIFGIQSLFGKTSSDSIDPRMYITSKDFQQQRADIPINLPIDKTLIAAFQMDVFCQQASWVLFVKKVEALTHK